MLALRHIIDVFARCGGLVACIPFPLPHRKVETKADAEGFRKDQAKLRRYWQRLGFKCIHKTDLLVMSTVRKMPDLETVLRGIDMNKVIPPE